MYQVELVCKSGSKLMSMHRLLSAAGSKALKVLNANREVAGLECVRILDSEGKEHCRFCVKAENFV